MRLGTAPRLTTIRRRADFLAANKALRAPMPGFVLLVRDRQDGDPSIRLGITVTRKIGGAVVRNRMKRRFRALAREVLPTSGIPGADHILIGRSGGVERPYDQLSQELTKALKKLKNTVRPEPVEGLPLTSFGQEKERASTSSARTDLV
ncbi:MAG TPA: ribonuclease P protein component [Allosphingosinicella sp.]|nr:ribonuclease P protein component [Allosphingosinicella sp.]